MLHIERIIPQESTYKTGEFLLKDNDENITELLLVFSVSQNSMHTFISHNVIVCLHFSTPGVWNKS